MKWQACGAIAMLSLLPGAASADPQISTALDMGGGVDGLRSRALDPVFHMALWSDVLLLRNRDSDMAVGPFATVGTTAFGSFDGALGLSWLVPVGQPVFAFSAGPGLRAAPGGLQPTGVGKVFFGSRSYNFHSTYGFALGGFVEGRVGLGARKEAELILGAQVDLYVLAIPFVFAWQALRR